MCCVGPALSFQRVPATRFTRSLSSGAATMSTPVQCYLVFVFSLEMGTVGDPLSPPPSPTPRNTPTGFLPRRHPALAGRQAPQLSRSRGLRQGHEARRPGCLGQFGQSRRVARPALPLSLPPPARGIHFTARRPVLDQSARVSLRQRYREAAGRGIPSALVAKAGSSATV